MATIDSKNIDKNISEKSPDTKIIDDNLKKIKKKKVKCGMCMEKIKKNIPKRVLKCTHTFHYECIKSWYIQLNKNNGMGKHIRRECPYCRKDGGYIKPEKGDKWIRNVHSYYYKPKSNKSSKSTNSTKS